MNNTQLLKEIKKTDKVCENFIDTAKKMMNHKDKSNSSKYQKMVELTKAMLEELEDVY